MSAEIYNFPCIIAGQTFNGVEFTILVNGNPVNIIAVEATFLSTKGKFVLTNGAGFTIIDGPNGKIGLDKQIIDWPFGSYDYQIKTTLFGGDEKYYISGKWVILKELNAVVFV